MLRSLVLSYGPDGFGAACVWMLVGFMPSSMLPIIALSPAISLSKTSQSSLFLISFSRSFSLLRMLSKSMAGECSPLSLSSYLSFSPNCCNLDKMSLSWSFNSSVVESSSASLDSSAASYYFRSAISSVCFVTWSLQRSTLSLVNYC